MERCIKALFILAFLICGCTVKEDRRDCPCYTLVNVDEFIASGFSRAMVSFSTDRLINREEINLAQYEGTGYEQALPRMSNRIAVVAGLYNSRISGDTLYVRKGLEADPVWLYTDKIICNDDGIVVAAVPRKQYCRLNIVVLGLKPWESFPYSFRVRSECNAINLYSCRPAEGEYCALAEHSPAGVCSVIIPRQAESNLLLDIFNSRDGSSLDGDAVFTLDLGARFRAEGYDWERIDLQDATVTIDYASLDMHLKIADWDADDVYLDQKI